MKLWRYGRAIEYLGSNQRYRLIDALGSGGMAEAVFADQVRHALAPFQTTVAITSISTHTDGNAHYKGGNTPRTANLVADKRVSIYLPGGGAQRTGGSSSALPFPVEKAEAQARPARAAVLSAAAHTIRRHWLLALTVALSPFLIVYVAHFHPLTLDPLPHLASVAPVAMSKSDTVTITLVLNAQEISDTFAITAVPGTADSTQRQVSARLLTATSPAQQKTVNAIGTKQVGVSAAAGTLTFSNGALQEQQIAAGTVFTSAGGVRVVNDVTANVPPANIQTNTFGRVTVPAHALVAGTAGNIPAGAINGTCCSANGSITVFSSAFAGGRDAASGAPIVQQSDIDAASKSMIDPATQQAQHLLVSQLRPGEQAAGSPQCTTRTTTDHSAGDQSATVTVTVAVTCQELAYDQNSIRNLATSLLRQEANARLGPGYALSGSVQAQISVQQANTASASLLVNVHGKWLYQLTNADEQRFVQMVAGRTVSQAMELLVHQKGIYHVSIQSNSTLLPGDVTKIQCVVQSM